MREVGTTLARTAGDYAWSLLFAVAVLAISAFLVIQLGVTARTGASTPEPARGHTVGPASANSCSGNTRGQLIRVSLAEQTLVACDGPAMVGFTPVTTGRVDLGDGTPLGTWHIVSRESDRHLSGADYRVFVHHWLPFFGDYGFHDSPWQDFAYGDRDLYRTRGSRGCVHVPGPAMDTLARWARVGTTVTIAA
ncbi:hypothetical protein GS4_03_01350 [Gordonia soli NBRC 108243]|uniref:L,D-TPase catalytic domain-containing protein n=2 Tax=Gordonia soli TaxID=320799 RepID=M0QGY4_9ACTN|nr:hypothetical protein GS4_03_01350 [Gordonia soli NBRC 108243]